MKYFHAKSIFYNSVTTPIVTGLSFILIFLLFFILWTFYIPIDSASISEGNVIFKNNVKKVFHHGDSLYISKILIKDGDFVRKGEPLIIFDSTKSKSDLQRVLWQLRYSILVDERLFKVLNLIFSYQIYNNFYYFPIISYNDFISYDNIKISKLINIQSFFFDTYGNFLQNIFKSSLLKIRQYINEFKLLQNRLNILNNNIIILKKDLSRKHILNKMKIENIDNISYLKIELQKYQNFFIEEHSKALYIYNKISEIHLQLNTFLNEQILKLLDDIKKNHMDLLILENNYNNVANNYLKTIIFAPYDGIISNLIINTTGTFIQDISQPLLEIVPKKDELIVETFIPTKDIYSINIGSEVNMHLNGHRSRFTPKFKGIVTYISPDKISIETYKLKSNFYKVYIELVTNSIPNNLLLIPGLSVVVFVVKGHRSFFDYLYSPFIDSLNKSFREL